MGASSQQICSCAATTLFPAELTDYINQDVGRAYPNAFSGSTNLWPRVVLLEASGELLGAFDTSLRSYALKKLHKSGNCEVRLGAAVERVEPGVVVLKVGFSSIGIFPFAVFGDQLRIQYTRSGQQGTPLMKLPFGTDRVERRFGVVWLCGALVLDPESS